MVVRDDSEGRRTNCEIDAGGASRSGEFVRGCLFVDLVLKKNTHAGKKRHCVKQHKRKKRIETLVGCALSVRHI